MRLEIDDKTALALVKELIEVHTEKRKRPLTDDEKETIRLIDENVLRPLYREARIARAPTISDTIKEIFS